MDSTVNAILTNFLYVVIVLTLILLARLAVVGYKHLVEYLNTKADKIENEAFRSYCKDMINAAESMTTQLLNGEEKKAWVKEKLIEYCKSNDKISFTDEQIDNLIQAVFNELDGISVNKSVNVTVTNEELQTLIASAVETALSTIK